MNSGDLKQLVEEARQAFDQSFVAEAQTALQAEERFVVLRVGVRQLAIRALEIGGLMRCPRVTPVFSARAGCLGITAVRGTIIGVHSLARLVGEETTGTKGRWLLLCQSDHTMAWCFDELVSYASVDHRDSMPDEPGEVSGPALARGSGATGRDDATAWRDVIRVNDTNCAVISMSELAQATRERRAVTTQGERAG